jgi:uncharacterized protein (TIGR02231 family)
MKTLLAALLTTTAYPAFSETFSLNTDVTAALITGAGGIVTYTAKLDLPAGHHTLLAHVPANYDPAITDIRFGAQNGITILARSYQIEKSTPAQRDDSQALQAAKQNLQAAESRLRAFAKDYDIKRAELDAAKLQITLLEETAKSGVGKSDSGISADQLIALITALGTSAQLAHANSARLAAELATLDLGRSDLAKAVEFASAVVDSLTPDGLVDLVQVTLDVSVANAVSTTVEIDNLEPLNWSPSYKIDLQQDKTTGTITLLRQAKIQFGDGDFQQPLDDWENVHIVLSTANLNDRTDTYIPAPDLKHLIDANQSRKSVSAGASYERLAADAAPEPIVMEIAQGSGFAGTQFAGQTLLFDLGTGHSIPWQAEQLEFTIDSLILSVDLYAMANATNDDYAFLYTDLKNETGGILLAGPAVLHRDGTLVGRSNIPQLFPDQTEALGLGPLFGIRLQRDTLNVQEGDSGFITAKSEINQSFRTTLTSSLAYTMPFKLLDVIPTSEDEDLVIRMTASPRPTDENRDGKRGVLVWEMDIAGGQSSVVNFAYQMKWPAEKIPTP